MQKVNRQLCVKTDRMADVHDGCSKVKERFSTKQNAPGIKRQKLSSSNYSIKKRQPYTKRRKRDTDIFVTRKTNFKALLKKCEKHFNSGTSEVIIHALGIAVHTACNLALQLKEIHYGAVELDIKTSTMSILDDFEPLDDSLDYETVSRNNSAIHIRVFRRFAISNLKYQQ